MRVSFDVCRIFKRCSIVFVACVRANFFCFQFNLISFRFWNNCYRTRGIMLAVKWNIFVWQILLVVYRSIRRTNGEWTIARFSSNSCMKACVCVCMFGVPFVSQRPKWYKSLRMPEWTRENTQKKIVKAYELYAFDWLTMSFAPWRQKNK